MKTFYSHLDEPGRGGVSYLFRNDYGMTEVEFPADADVIIWNGGEDIATSIYDEDSIGNSGPFLHSPRDKAEIRLFQTFAGNPDKLLLGICRGAQLLNCLNGGKLYQDVDGHHSSHDMIDLRTMEVLKITSTHHQQMRPGPDGEVIGVSNLSTYKRSGADGLEHFQRMKEIKDGRDVEIVWYPITNTLCIQGHPEYVPGSHYAEYTLGLLNECWEARGVFNGKQTA